MCEFVRFEDGRYLRLRMARHGIVEDAAFFRMIGEVLPAAPPAEPERRPPCPSG
jgi:hypothetical protein